MVMKLIALLLCLTTISCNTPLTGKVMNGMKNKSPIYQLRVDPDRFHHLKILEAEYTRNDEFLKLSLVKTMILETKGRFPAHGPQRDFRKSPNFLALKLTIEHLAHREEFRMQHTRNAFHHQR